MIIAKTHPRTIINLFSFLLTYMKKYQQDTFLFNEALRELPLATAIYDNPNLNIGFANPMMLAIWYCNQDIIGNPFSEIFPGFTQDGYADLLKNVWESGTTYNAFEAPVNIYNGDLKIQRYFNFEYKPLVDKRGQTYSILHTATDVTEKVKLAEVKAQEQLLNNSSQLEMISRSLSHDVKSPLALSEFAVTLLKERSNMPVRRRQELFNLIDESLHDINDIIERVIELTVGPIAQLKRQFIHLDDALTLLCREAKVLFRAPHIQFIFGNLFPLDSDPASIYQIFTHLINNAVKYSAANKKAQVEIYSEKAKNGLIYYIKDNGIGIAPHELEHIRFGRLRRDSAGHSPHQGVGLAIVQELMKRLNAQFMIFSRVDRGTEIRLFFPIN